MSEPVHTLLEAAWKKFVTEPTLNLKGYGQSKLAMSVGIQAALAQQAQPLTDAQRAMMRSALYHASEELAKEPGNEAAPQYRALAELVDSLELKSP
jgi:hypothetical protein